MKCPSISVKYYVSTVWRRHRALRGLLPALLLAGTAAAQCPPALHPYTVQGAGSDSPHEGDRVLVKGTVTAVDWREHGQQGFYLQGPPDRDPHTSDALFIYAPNLAALSTRRPRPGERWVAEGQVKEFYGLTELTDLNRADYCAEGRMPSAVSAAAPGEALEGMRVSLNGPVIVDNYPILRTGTLIVQDHAGQRWHLEDGSNRRSLTRLPWGLAQDATRIANGTPLADLTGVLTRRWSQWVVIPDNTPAPVHHPTWQWPAHNPARLSVVSWNLENLFNGHKDDFSDSRRANRRAEWTRQLNRTAEALAALNADLFMLQEVEHDRGRHSTTALSELTQALNTRSAPARFQSLQPVFRNGDDAITTAFLYRADRLAPAGTSSRIKTEPRLSLRQTFEEIGTGRQFTAINVHLKSRNGCPEPACLATRRQALARLATAGARASAHAGGPILLGGDFNTLADESVWQVLADESWHRIEVTGPSYWYRGRPQQLDHFWWKGPAENRPHSGQAVAGQAEMPPIPLDHPLLQPESPWGVSDHNPISVLW